MTITNALFYLLAIAGISMGISALLMLMLALLNFTKLGLAVNGLKDQLFEFLLNAALLGLGVFLLCLAGLSLKFAVNAVYTGAYHLQLNRYGGGVTHIFWKERPVRFAFQTLLFIGFSGWIVYFLTKMIRNKLKNRKGAIK